MRKLNLPVSKGRLSKPKHLSMDDYLRFVLFGLKHTYNKAAARKLKKLSAVNVPFVMK
jgi:hypothetical protein